MQSYFITGTDTEVGKTFVTERLLKAAASTGLSTLGYKPVSAGCFVQDERLVNEDALAIQGASSIAVPIEQINPIAFAPPIAPHIAAKEEGKVIELQEIVDGYHRLAAYRPDVLLMEGAGGWRLPLGESSWMSQVVSTLELDVIMVVGMRLGCINHAMLTAEIIAKDGLTVKGWVANQLSASMPYYSENLETLKRSLPAPLLAEVPFNCRVDSEILIPLRQIFA
ncbi:dethiobiotin synthase [Alteromonas pelagimontana]|uniref:ATP-dependent dethiobiotin synthetase BioD n=1 Tax=Alteromonas pelagimontana TaxID=1858656 RepID=A0A6M4MAF2_9ALTE|nr:dethiobiotin synthase [Alteromonas pelagimontana]QJR79798.1 dethiobiotin synthase [Alteromonas pelagimontana]